MGSHYTTLRIQPEKDIQGKSEAEIIKKVENNYKALVARAPQMYPDMQAREIALKNMEEARVVLIDKEKRLAYEEQLKTHTETELNMMKEASVTVEFIHLEEGEEYIPSEDDNKENK